MSLIGFSGAANAQQQVTDTNVSSDKKILVAYSPVPEQLKK